MLEAEVIPRIKDAISFGLEVLENAFERVEIEPEPERESESK